MLSHACGAAFDAPDLIVAAVVGDGEAETGPLAASWHVNKFLNPIRDGAVLPVLSLNGYKIDNPTLLARIPPDELTSLLRGCGWTPLLVEGSDPDSMHQAMAATLDRCVELIRGAQAEARRTGIAERPRWPMIVLRAPEGLDARRAELDGHKLEGSWRAHQVPIVAREGGSRRGWRCSSAGCGATGPRSSSTPRERPSRACARSRPAGGAAWARTRTRTAGC